MEKHTTKTGLFGAVLVFAAVLLANPVSAQDVYHPIADNCLWSSSNEKYMSAGDTVLGGRTYMKLYRQIGNQSFEFNLEEAEYFAAIRNDSVEKKVYAYLPAGTWIRDLGDYSVIQTDTAMEVLLYDFSIKIGDTVCYYSLGGSGYVAKNYAVHAESANIYVGQHDNSAVTHQYSIADTLVYLSDNSSRCQILLQGLSYYPEDNVWIEGVGGIRGFDEGTQMNLSDYGQRILLCFSDSSEATFQTEFDFDEDSDDCFSNGFGGDLPEKEMLDVRVYPNPVTEQLHISTRQFDNQSVVVNIFNIMGVCVYSVFLEGLGGDAEIYLGFLPKGIYIMKIEQSIKHFAYKIIKL